MKDVNDKEISVGDNVRIVSGGLFEGEVGKVVKIFTKFKSYPILVQFESGEQNDFYDYYLEVL